MNASQAATPARGAVPATLDHAGIAARIPHAGSMCLLDRVLRWDAASIDCAAVDHRHVDHPLRTRSGLLATAAIEYAAQAVAVHGALVAGVAGAVPAPGFLASARDVQLHAWRLDDLPAGPAEGGDELAIRADRLAADAGRLLYAFTVRHAERPIATGRLAVVLDGGDAAAAR